MIKPKCVTQKEPALTAEGFFLPCCWCDRRNQYFKDKGFFHPALNISNVGDIVSEVFMTNPWVQFFEDVQTNHPDLPSVCHEHCGVNQATSKKVRVESKV